MASNSLSAEFCCVSDIIRSGIIKIQFWDDASRLAFVRESLLLLPVSGKRGHPLKISNGFSVQLNI